MDEKKLSQMLERIQQWHRSQQSQTSGYEYERSFDQMWTQMGNELMQESIGELPSDKRKKNDKNQFRRSCGVSQALFK